MREVMLNNAGKYDDINMILWCQIKNNIARNIQHDHSAFSEMISAWQKKIWLIVFTLFTYPCGGISAMRIYLPLQSVIILLWLSVHYLFTLDIVSIKSAYEVGVGWGCCWWRDIFMFYFYLCVNFTWLCYAVLSRFVIWVWAMNRLGIASTYVREVE